MLEKLSDYRAAPDSLRLVDAFIRASASTTSMRIIERMIVVPDWQYREAVSILYHGCTCGI